MDGRGKEFKPYATFSLASFEESFFTFQAVGNRVRVKFEILRRWRQHSASAISAD